MQLFGGLHLSICLFMPVVFCRHVVHSLHLSWKLGAPDGNQRYMVHVNGQFPAPELRLKYGDSIEVSLAQ